MFPHHFIMEPKAVSYVQGKGSHSSVDSSASSPCFSPGLRILCCKFSWACQVSQKVKNLPAMQET